MNKEIVLLLLGLIWGVYAIIVGTLAVLSQYNNDLLWISIIVAISGTTGAHVALSMSAKGISLQSTGQVRPEPPPTVKT